MRMIALILLAGCAETRDVEPLGDYTQWPKKVIATGEVPGHGNTYRVIYANDLANKLLFGGAYPIGSTIVKEVYDHEGGALEEVAIMRMRDDYPRGYSDEGGWLFTLTDSPGGEEHYNERCWRTCHVAAPYRGAWLFYGKR